MSIGWGGRRDPGSATGLERNSVEEETRRLHRCLGPRLDILVVLTVAFMSSACTKKPDDRVWDQGTISDNFEGARINSALWEAAGAKGVDAVVEGGMLTLKGDLVAGDTQNSTYLLQVNAPLAADEAYVFRVRHRFEVPPEFRHAAPRRAPEVIRPSAPVSQPFPQEIFVPPPADPVLRRTPEPPVSPPASVFGFFDVERNKGGGFHPIPGGLLVLIRGPEVVEPFFSDVRTNEWHDYQIRYDAPSGEISFWVDQALLVQSRLPWAEYAAILGLTAWEGEGLKRVAAASFSGFALERTPP